MKGKKIVLVMLTALFVLVWGLGACTTTMQEYDLVGPYSEGRARVWKNGTWFHIGLTGKRIAE